ncbi:MAG: uncharacterized protein KVP18_002923 [Porospora cf. gigantea A]|nr:MAG: hypothetical protein KVP18_002923 [Porospora cf. gigantea A]
MSYGQVVELAESEGSRNESVVLLGKPREAPFLFSATILHPVHEDSIQLSLLDSSLPVGLALSRHYNGKSGQLILGSNVLESDLPKIDEAGDTVSLEALPNGNVILAVNDQVVREFERKPGTLWRPVIQMRVPSKVLTRLHDVRRRPKYKDQFTLTEVVDPSGQTFDARDLDVTLGCTRDPEGRWRFVVTAVNELAFSVGKTRNNTVTKSTRPVSPNFQALETALQRILERVTDVQTVCKGNNAVMASANCFLVFEKYKRHKRRQL